MLEPNLKNAFNRIYDVRKSAGHLLLPEPMRQWVEKRFGSIETAAAQVIIKITNIVTGEGALFNNLRAVRPLGGSFSEQELEERIEDEKSRCCFCRATEATPADPFGRIRGRFCLTAGNLAKFDGYHGLVIFNEHHPLRFGRDMVEDYFTVAGRWFARVREDMRGEPPGYPLAVWNCLWQAGSSIVHGHMQLSVTRGMHYPRVEYLRRAAEKYRQRYGSNYFEELYAVHRALGLAFNYAGVRVMACLTPVKEKEVWMLAPAAPDDSPASLSAAIYSVLNSFITGLRVNSFNLAVYMPPAGATKESWKGFPFLARLVDRGNALSRTADIGSMELFAASVVAGDPFGVAGFLAEHLKP